MKGGHGSLPRYNSSIALAAENSIHANGPEWTASINRNFIVVVGGNTATVVAGSSDVSVEGSKTLAAGDNVEIYAGKAIVIACEASSIVLSDGGEIHSSASK